MSAALFISALGKIKQKGVTNQMLNIDEGNSVDVTGLYI